MTQGRRRGIAGATVCALVASGDRADVPSWAIIVVDGPSRNRSSTEREAARVRSAGVRLSAIGVGTRVNVAELTAIATTPSVDRYVFNYTQLADGFAQRFLCDNLALKGLLKTSVAW